MRLRTAVTATVLAAIAVLGGSGLAAADGFGTGPGDGFNPGEHRWVMSAVNFGTPIDLSNMPIGAEYASGPPAAGYQITHTVGCAGPNPGSFTFDGAAVRATVRVEQG